MRSPHARILGMLLGLAGLLAAAPAAASSAVILPRTGGSGVGPEARAAAEEALTRVLTNEGWTVYDLDAISTDLPPALAACGPEDRCAHELRALLDVDVAFGLRVWGTEDAVERVSVVAVGMRGVGHRALAEVTEAQPLPFAVAEAARGAVAMWAQGDLSEAAPRGVAGDLAERWEPAHLEPSPLNWFVGALLVLGSAPLLGYGINSAVRDGDCVTQGPGGGCVERIRFREGAAILGGMGLTLFVSGIVTWIAQPIQVAVRADVESASLQLSGSF